MKSCASSPGGCERLPAASYSVTVVGPPMTRILIIVLIAVTAVTPWAQMPISDRAAVEDYRAAIAAVKAAPVPRGIETAFSKLVALGDALSLPRTNQVSVLESLSDEEFKRLAGEIPGAWINRE